MTSPIENVLRELINDTRGYYPEEGDTHIPNAISQIRGLMPKHIKKYAIEGESPLTEREIGHNLCLSEVLKLFTLYHI